MTEEWGEIQGKWDLVRVNGTHLLRVRIIEVLLYLHVFLPAQEQGLLSITSSNGDDGKIAYSGVLPRNFQGCCPESSLKYYKN